MTRLLCLSLLLTVATWAWANGDVSYALWRGYAFDVDTTNWQQDYRGRIITTAGPIEVTLSELDKIIIDAKTIKVSSLDAKPVVELPAPGFEHLGKRVEGKRLPDGPTITMPPIHIVTGDYYLAGELLRMENIHLGVGNTSDPYFPVGGGWLGGCIIAALNVYRNDDNTLVGWIPVVVPEKEKP